jgi:transposase-like protein
MPDPAAADDFFPLPEEYSEEPQPLSEQQARMLTALFRSKPEVWLSVEQLSGRLGIPVNTLRAWRRQGHGPKGTKLGRGRSGAVRYRLAEIERWEREQDQAPAASQQPRGRGAA